MFKRMLSAFGAGGPSVDTVLDSPTATPGEVITGRVRIQGGSNEVVLDQVVVALVTRVEMEFRDHEGQGIAEFHRQVVRRDVRVSANEPLDLPFELTLPWETPITAVGDVALPGVIVGVRTDLEIKGAPDKGDLDPVLVRPLPSQDRVLDAFGELGATFRSTDVEVGRIVDMRQELRFYQEIEFFPPPNVAGRIPQVELTFVASARDLWVILEADKRRGLLRSGADSFGRFHVTHEDTPDWASMIGEWLMATAAGAPRGFARE